MKNLDFKLIDPLQFQERTLDLLLQLNPEMDLEQMKKTLHEMVAVPNYRCFALFDKGELIGISTGWTTVRIYCGKQLELDNVIIDSSIQSKGLGTHFVQAIEEWSLNNGYNSIGLNTYVQNSRSHKFYFNLAFKILGFHFEKRLS